MFEGEDNKINKINAETLKIFARYYRVMRDLEDCPVFRFALRKDLKTREFLPTKSESFATGWDVRCAESDGVILKPFESYKIRLGFRAFCPAGYWFELKPRSSSFTKKHLNALYGTIDETYENELIFACQYIPATSWKPAGASYNVHMYTQEFDLCKFLSKDVMTEEAPKIEFGERIAQIVPIKRQEMIVSAVTNDEFDSLCAERNAERKGGFGSTGNK